MSKFIVIAFASAWIVTVASAASGEHPGPSSPRVAKNMMRVIKVPEPTWTCAHNTYRTVACD